MPDGALLLHYGAIGAFTDCYTYDVDSVVSHSDFVYAFYTSPLFKIERFILKWIVAKPSTDADVAALALGTSDVFSAWSVEGRAKDQLLVCDYQRRTRSWLMVLPLDGGAGTRLFFGTAVARLRPDGRKDRAFGLAFKLLVGFHKLYARALLRDAVAKL
jgi:hypothetical protein